MIPQVLSVAAALALAGGHGAQQSSGYQQDPMGPISDVTSNWRAFQPATTFCVKPDVAEYAAGGNGATDTGADPICRRSGFARNARNLVRIHVKTPPLCAGCRRLFIDFSKIPAKNSPPNAYAHGHAFYRLSSANFTYTVNPVDHSPNTKNFTNDKLLTPDGSPQETVIGATDLHDMSYVTDTAHFVHTASQGPYYIGPWYLNRRGQKVNGVYLDVDVRDATRFPGGAQANGIGYTAGFNSGQACLSDDDAYYGGCSDWGGSSAEMVDPFPGG